MLKNWRQAAQNLKNETHALYLAYRDPRTPWYAKAWAVIVVAYALSPIDLIPDFIPILGYLDDLVLIPAGIGLALKMIPVEVMDDARNKAQQEPSPGSHLNWIAAVAISVVWLIVIALGIFLILKYINRN